MQISLSSAVLKEEFALLRRVLLKWDEKIKDGIPGQDGIRLTEEQFESMALELRAEMMLCGDTCHSIAARLIDGEE
jgi:hypothetical protein